jgi:hypothetical protein
MSEDAKYFAAKSSKDTAQILMNKADNWFSGLATNGYFSKLGENWKAYHGIFGFDLDDAHSITFGGEQGELVNLNVNHFRNIAQNMLVMITSNRPSMRARATNTDEKSIIQTNLANSLLDYYMREKRLAKYLRRATEYAIVLGSGYIKMEWNQTTGDAYDYDEISDVTTYSGDVEFTNLSPYDVVFDSSQEDQNHNWVLCRSYKNKYDLAAKYPELKDDIESLPTKSELDLSSIDFYAKDDTELVPVYEFFHKSTESIPDGRYLLFLSPELTLIDMEMPYRALPVYRIAPSDILGTPFGYTSMFDILPLQHAINSLYSTILTNHSAFGVQNIWAKDGSNINVSSISDGLNLIESDEPPVALNLTQTPAEIFNFISILERVTETLSGVNSVTRGNPDASIKSGTALALVQSMAIQFMSGLQQEYIELIEDVGTGLISMLRDFADTPRVAAIVGVNNLTELKKFVGDDLSLVNRVMVDASNPISQTVAGRIQMADNLLQYLGNEGGFDMQKYFDVIQSGNLNTLTENIDSSNNLMRGENERLISNRPVKAMFTDDHLSHIKDHRSILDDLELRFNRDIADRVRIHLQEHIELLRETDPDLLALMGQQPLAPVGGSPVNPETPPGASPGSSPDQISDLIAEPTEQAAGEIAGIPLPSPAEPPPIP